MDTSLHSHVEWYMVDWRVVGIALNLPLTDPFSAGHGRRCPDVFFVASRDTVRKFL
jgi:hypothetical protein